jgi:two-component system, LytTR family, response regulator LytT
MEKKVQILLVEDELIIADYMQECLQKLGYEVCATCINYGEAVEALATYNPDVILVDITLKGNKTGIDLGNYIKQNYNVPFIFATSHSDKATIDKAKQTLPYAYLIKPFSEDDLYAVIETALMHYGRQQQKEAVNADENPIIINDGIFIKNKGKYIKLTLEELLYIEANDNYCTISTTANNFVLKTTLKSLLDVLPEYFWRTHRSYIVNLHHLKSFDTETIYILNKSLPLGKSFYPLLIEKLKIVQG